MGGNDSGHSGGAVLGLLISQQPGLGDRVIAVPDIMTNLLQLIITCFETCQNLEIDFLSTTRQSLQSIKENAVTYCRQGHLSGSVNL